MPDFREWRQKLAQTDCTRRTGRVRRVVGLLVETEGPPAQIGEVCQIHSRGVATPAEVVGFHDGYMLMMPLGPTENLGPRDEVVATGGPLRVPVGEGMLGGVFDALGQPLQGEAFTPSEFRMVSAPPPGCLERRRITEPLPLGLRSLDGLCTVGQGQRLGIMAGAGVGKSVLLGMIARNTRAEVNVIGLIGERGREVREFIEQDLGPEGLARSVVVVATSDQPPLLRLRAAYTATAIAEYFRDQGKAVLLLMDSLTRVAWAQRDMGLACGEPPTRNGYTPSVFAMLPSLLERAGANAVGSITGLYTVLVEGDDLGDPVADHTRSILDGHLVLSRRLAEQGHYPAVDVLQSLSRLFTQITTPEHRRAALQLRELLAVYAEAEDLINLGAYAPGSNRRLDRAVGLREEILGFLRQDLGTRTDFAETVAWLQRVTGEDSAWRQAA
ncbi:MAG TPA: FliI/YscN family ATPase [Armatimonadota bacterium]|jgi:flagellum-specific ATP synthase